MASVLFGKIKSGDRIEITPRRGGGSVYVSQVEEIAGGEMLIHMPITYGKTIKLPQSGAYRMLFFTEAGMLDFDVEITGYKKEDNIDYMTARIIGEGEVVQRREFFRFNILLPLRFTVIDDSTNPDPTKEIWADGIIKDISGGGLRFVSNADMPEKGKIKCMLMLGNECVIIIGNVLSKQTFPKSNFKYQYRINFAGLTNEDREKVVQFIFVEQRKELMRNRANRT